MAVRARKEYEMDSESEENEFEMDLDELKKRNENEKQAEAADEQTEAKTVVYSEVTAADRPILQWLRKVMIFGFVLIFVGACLWQVSELKKESAALEETVAELEQQIEDEKAKELEIKVEKEYYQSIAYKEQMARDRCKLIYPNEILISIQNNSQ